MKPVHCGTCAEDTSAYTLCGDFGADSSCLTPVKMANGINVMVALVLLYFVVTCGVLLKKLRALNSLPYDRYQGAIVFYRLQVIYRGFEVLHATAAALQSVHLLCQKSVAQCCGTETGEFVDGPHVCGS